MLAINHTNTVTITEKGTYVRSQKFKRLLTAPFTIYSDSESTLKLAIDNKNDFLNTKIYQDHIVCGYYYYTDEQNSRPYKFYFGKDAIDRCVTYKTITNESEHCSGLLEINLNKRLVATEKKL